MGIFSLDGPFYKFGSMLADLIILSLLWIVFSLPIVTIGASSTAAFYVASKRVSGTEGYLFRDFWKSFKENFLLSTMVFITFVAIVLLLLINIVNINMMGNAATILYPLQLCILLEVTMVMIYAFPLLSRFEMRYFALLRSAFFMANRHLLTTILHIVFVVLMAFVVYSYEIFILIVAGVYAFFSAYFIMKVFKKYRPEVAGEPIDDELAPLNLDEDDIIENYDSDSNSL